MAKHTIEVIARGIIGHGDAVLLCVNRAGGYSYLPGGHVEFEESATEALIREVAEETGLKMHATRLLLVTEESFYDGKRMRHEVNLVFHVEHSLGRGAVRRLVPSREGKIEFRWCRHDELMTVDLRPASIREWLLEGRPADGAAWRSGVAAGAE